MVEIYFILFICVVFILVFKKVIYNLLLKLKTSKGLEYYPYGKQKSLLSPAEKNFLNELDRIINENYRIFSKVRLADVIKVGRGLPDSRWQSAFNRIQSKHLDFLICAREDFSIVGAIELDDKSHALPERRERDIFINSALAAAGIPILRYPPKRNYFHIELR
ncbi:MAG: DUF2726 domain-containing protein [Sedimentisphaerales bacterium]|nr:DUF2726 domain-containing protein [Sedimentisphaerales bacterium]